MTSRISVAIDPDLADLVPGFLDNRRKDVARLAEHLAAGNYAEIRRLGHSMKGAGGGYGFDAITDLGGEIEAAALHSDAAAIEDLAARLADYLDRLDVVLAD